MATRDVEELRDVCARIELEHRALAQSLDALEASCARLRLGAIPKREVEDAIYDLFLKLDDHVIEEERMLGRVAGRRRSVDEAARLELMFHEHEAQRTMFLSALESTEQGILESGRLVALSARLVRTLRADIALEDELLGALTASRRGPGAHPSR